jgi:hypothetical protein
MKKIGIGKVAEGEILKGASAEEVLNVIHAHFPGANTNKRCIYSYTSRLRAAGYEIKRAA